MKFRSTCAVALLAALVAPFTAQDPVTPKPAQQGPVVGKAAPAFRVNDHEGRAVAVGGERKDGMWTVLAFYPKAATRG